MSRDNEDSSKGKRNQTMTKKKLDKQSVVKSRVETEEDQFIDMEVGQDNEFVSEDSDDESNVVVFNREVTRRNDIEKGMEAVEGQTSDEEEDGELREILEKNYEMAGLKSPGEKDRDSIINEAVDKFQEVFMKSNFMEVTTKLQQQLLQSQKQVAEQNKELVKLKAADRNSRDQRERGKTSNDKPMEQVTKEVLADRKRREKQLTDLILAASESELTIYRSAVENQLSKRDSSSSEEHEGAGGYLNSSDEIDVLEVSEQQDVLIDQFIADVRAQNQQRNEQRANRPQRHHNCVEDGQQPGTSQQANQLTVNQQSRNSPEEKANNLIRNAEQSRVRIHQIQGNDQHIRNNYEMPQYELDLSNEFVHSAMVDENYHLVRSHIDSITQEKIIQGDYVDFAKLVPRDRVLTADDHRYEMIVKEGKTYWVPANDKEVTVISSYSRWEQAFRVFSEIYMKRTLTGLQNWYNITI